MNALTLTGNLTADPEKVTLPDGRSLANFRIGNSEWYNGETRDNGFFDVTAFGDQADNVLDKLSKGSRIIVTGRLQHSTYEKADGSRGGRTKLVASAIGVSLEFKPKDATEAPTA
jgi:single-strand DNA-binding protein